MKNNRKALKFLFAAFLLASIFIPMSFAQEAKFPGGPQGYVNDYVGTLSQADREKIENFARELKEKTTAQVAVAVVKTVRPEMIENYAVKLFQRWGVGQKGKDNGVLLLVALDDREVRIEVGYGLEGALPDVICNKIIQNVIIPNFKAGNYSKGIRDGVSAIVGLAAKEYNVTVTGAGEDIFESEELNSNIGLILAIVFVIIILRFFLWPSIFLPPGGRHGGYWHGSGGGFGGGGFGGGFGGFGGGMSGGGGASGRW